MAYRVSRRRSASMLIHLRGDGTFRLDMQYFNYCTGLTMTNERFAALFGGPAREPREPGDPTRDGSRCFDPGSYRGRGIAPCKKRSIRKPVLRACVLPGGLPSIVLLMDVLLREGPFRRPVGAARGGRCRVVRWVPQVPSGINYLGNERLGRTAMTACAAGTSDHGLRARRFEASSTRSVRSLRNSPTATCCRGWQQHLIDEIRRGLGPGPHGIRTAGAWRAIDHRRPAQSRRCRV